MINQPNTGDHVLMKYDFGINENLKRYGQEIPPLYDLKKIKVDFTVIAAPRDQFSPMPD